MNFPTHMFHVIFFFVESRQFAPPLERAKASNRKKEELINKHEFEWSIVELLFSLLFEVNSLYSLSFCFCSYCLPLLIIIMLDVCVFTIAFLRLELKKKKLYIHTQKKNSLLLFHLASKVKWAQTTFMLRISHAGRLCECLSNKTLI